MKLGLMWFDDSKNTFTEKCNRAIKYYQEKFGRAPTTIWVNPKTAITEIPDIVFVQSQSILLNNLWIGED